jgi:hypothetical protein
MQTVKCPDCGAPFDFDPNKIWDSPTEGDSWISGSEEKVVIQCPTCKHWMIARLRFAHVSQPAQKPGPKK